MITIPTGESNLSLAIGYVNHFALEFYPYKGIYF